MSRRFPAPQRSKQRLRAEELGVLKLLAIAGADHTPVVWTSREVGEKIGMSQQAADRYLLALERRGLLTRSLAARRQRLSLTPAALEVLQVEYHTYRRIFEGPSKLHLSGAVVSGLGEGRYYLSQPGYVVQFTERLGYRPYPGTLNVRVSGETLRKLALLKQWSGIRIDGYQASGRTFGGATCYPARLNGRSSHLIVPDRTHYQDVVEFIAADFLREALNLKDLDLVSIEVEEL